MIQPPAITNSTATGGFLSVDNWWIRIPAKLRRYWTFISTAWSDGIYLTAWPGLATLLPIAFFFIGLLEGATHWNPLRIGSAALSANPPVTFVQMLPLLVLAAAAGSLSANLGLMIVLGYALGDFVLAGPAFALGNADFVARIFRLRAPQLISYLFFFLVAVQPILTAQFLTSTWKWLARRTSPPFRILTVLLVAAIQGALIYGWTLAAPMVIRILWNWAARIPPMTVAGFANAAGLWLPATAVAAVISRGVLTAWALGRNSAREAMGRLIVALRQADQHPAISRRLPVWVRVLAAAGAATLLISGFLSTLWLGAVMFGIIALIFLARLIALPSLELWRRWARLAQRLPLLFRWITAASGTYGLTRAVLAAPGQATRFNGIPGAFQAELISICLSLVLFLVLVPGDPANSARHQPMSSAGAIQPQAATLTILYLLCAPSVYATCLDPVCCFGSNQIAALAVLGLALLLYGWMLLPFGLAELLAGIQLLLPELGFGAGTAATFAEIQSEAFTDYLAQAETLDISTAENEAVFYSGQGNRALAEQFAEANGKFTLEKTSGGKWLDQQELFGPNSPLTGTQARVVWENLSQRFADNASGTSISFVNGAGPDSIFNTVEYPTLLNNPKILNVLTGGN